MGIDPKCRFHGATAIPDCGRYRLLLPPGDHLDKTAGEQLTNLVKTDIATPIGRGLRKFTEHHQFG